MKIKSRQYLIILIFSVISFFLGAYLMDFMENESNENAEEASELFGIEFTETELDSLSGNLKDLLKDYKAIRELDMPNSVWPALQFNPIPLGFDMPTEQKELNYDSYAETKLPENSDDLAYYSIGQLAELIRTKQITSVELTTFFIERLKKYDPMIHCVITPTYDLAMEQALKADAEMAAGNYKGMLHGIPFGVKDLLAAKNYKTTFGATSYKDQVIDVDATVVKKLREAGAVLLAKLSLGALAMDDVWFDAMTKNPWDTLVGSSGSSAGPAAAVSAGLLPFAIGSETWGSIVSPSNRCGVTGLRPTYGRVSRTGGMALSWTMDKLGPICRNVEDCAIVFDAIYGADGEDQTIIEAPFNYNHETNFSNLKIGYLKSEFEKDSAWMDENKAALKKLEEMGAELVPLELPDLPIWNISFVLTAESAAAFDELTLSGRDDLLVLQHRNAWPNIFRFSRFIPAVEYIQANRVRYLLIQEMEKMMSQVDLMVAPSFGKNLLATNLTGHPSVVVPNGFESEKQPLSIVFTGKLFDEGTILAVAKAYQDATGHHLKRPTLD